MGNKLFGIDVSGLIHKFISPGVLPATLLKVTAGARTPGSLTGGMNPTETSHACRGFIDSMARRNREGTLIEDGTETIVLIGDSIAGGAVPQTGDKVTIEGRTFRIEGPSDRDPAAATYTLVCRAI